jgi:hypothetical protein
MSRTETFTRVSAAHRATSGSSGQRVGSDTSGGAASASPAPSSAAACVGEAIGQSNVSTVKR